MPEQHIPLIMQIMDKIVSPDDRKRKYTDLQILKVLVLLQIFRMTGLNEIPSFQTLSRRARLSDLHAVNREITFIYTMESISAIDSFMIHTCKYSTAARRKTWKNYRDPESGWSKTTKGWAYGRKCHMTLDVDSLLIMEWLVTRGNLHDSRASHELIDSVRNFSYILADSAYLIPVRRREVHILLVSGSMAFLIISNSTGLRILT